MHHIAYITDNGYAIPTVASINSLVRNVKDAEITVHVVAVELSEGNRARLAALGSDRIRVEIVDVANEYCQFKGCHSYVSEAALFKFSLPDIFHDIDRLLFIDGDTLIHSGATGIFETDISDVYAAVVTDMVAMREGRWHEKLGLIRYFNSSVMYLNLANMRDDGIPGKLVAWFGDQNNDRSLLEQHALNFVFGGKVKWLGLRYNCIACYKDFFPEDEILTFFGETAEALRSPAILHLAGSRKPWNDCLSEEFHEWAQYATAESAIQIARDFARSLANDLSSQNAQHAGLVKAHEGLLRMHVELVKLHSGLVAHHEQLVKDLTALKAEHAQLAERVAIQERRLGALENTSLRK
jgi:lipopolysaccharide biosynthesis glycosyltransferase